MGFLDVFSGSKGRNNAVFGLQFAQQGFDNLSRANENYMQIARGDIANANANVQNRYDLAEPKITGAFGEARDAARGALSGGYNTARTDLSTGMLGARNTLTGARDIMQPYVEQGQRADTLYQGAIGMNGAEAGAAAREAFTEAPGYQYQVNQGSEALARKAASLGSAASGATMDAIRGNAQQQANTGWNSWLDRLSGVGERGFKAAGSQLNLEGQIADAYSKEGAGLANLAMDYGKTGGAMEQSMGRDEATILEQLLRGRTGLEMQGALGSANAVSSASAGLTNLGNNFMNNAMGQITKGGEAGEKAAANNFSAIMGLLNTGIGLGTKLFA